MASIQVFTYVCDQCGTQWQSTALAATSTCPQTGIHPVLIPKVNGLPAPTGTAGVRST